MTNVSPKAPSGFAIARATAMRHQASLGEAETTDSSRCTSVTKASASPLLSGYLPALAAEPQPL